MSIVDELFWPEEWRAQVEIRKHKCGELIGHDTWQGGYWHPAWIESANRLQPPYPHRISQQGAVCPGCGREVYLADTEAVGLAQPLLFAEINPLLPRGRQTEK